MKKYSTISKLGILLSMKNYRFGFSLKGFIAFVFVMIPNIIWMLVPPVNNPIAGNNAPDSVFEIVLGASQFALVASLIILNRRDSHNNKTNKILIVLAFLCLTGYYVSWISYYAGIVNPWMFVGMAVLPSVYFIAVGLWLKNYVSIIPGIVFGITHTIITCLNLW
jgi:small-conductance mechanosensitive channel